MPTYDFKCDDCELETEIVRSMKDTSDVLCEKCSKPMRQVISGGGFILKGEGWAGQDIKRMDQDKAIGQLAKKARKIKEEGRAKMEDVLTFEDVKRMEP